MIKHNFHLLKPLFTTNNSYIIKTSDKYISKVFYNSLNYHNEVNILQSLQHDNIIRIHKHFVDEYNKGVIEFKYYEDGDLLSFINKHVRKKNSTFSNNKKISLFKQIINPLIYCHSKNIIHGDIKPDNILLHNNVPIIIDFGLSIHDVHFNNTLIKNPTIYFGQQGSRGYIAPEVYDNYIGPCSDVFSLGVLLYNLFTNEMPQYKNNTFELSIDTISSNNIPFKIDTLLHDMLEQNFEERPTLKDIYYEYSL